MQTRAGRDGIAGVRGDRLIVRLGVAPVDGKANAQLIGLLAKSFGTAKTRVRIVRGLRGRNKTVEIDAPGRWPEQAPDGVRGIAE